MGLLFLAVIGSALAAQVITVMVYRQAGCLFIEKSRHSLSMFSGFETNPGIATGSPARAGKDCWG